MIAQFQNSWACAPADSQLVSSRFKTFVATDGRPPRWDLSAPITYSFLKPCAKWIARCFADCLEQWSAATNGALRFLPVKRNGAISLLWDVRGVSASGVILGYCSYIPDVVVKHRIVGATLAINASGPYSWHVGAPLGVSPIDRRGKRAVDLTGVALHELGHALGIDHSNGTEFIGDVPTMHSIIYPGAERLHYDDIQAVQSLYGK